ncbi:MAG: ABC transporter permease [Chloroflexi bacterium]|nr:ABC transporter permease [Chloroflexota bacterium]
MRRQRRFNPARLIPALFGGTIVLGVALMAIFAPLLSPGDPNLQTLPDRLKPPSWMAEGRPDHFLGTDSLGRDILSRIIHGSRISLVVGVAAVLFSGSIGVPLGLLAGYFGGMVDAILARIADVQQAIPFLILAIAVVAVIGSSLANLILVLAITTWVLYFRVVRGETLSLREEEYIWAARAVGCDNWRIIWRHIFPNLLPSVIVIATLLVANMILFEAALSFLGLGLPPPTPTWGRMVSEGRDYLASAWWIPFFPGLAILITVLGINLLGDWVRDVLDPRRRISALF